VGIFIVETAVQAAVKIGTAMRAELLPHHLPFDLKFLFACMADIHENSSFISQRCNIIEEPMQGIFQKFP
jgi:hypothetical protein